MGEEMLLGTQIRPDMTIQIVWGEDGWPTGFTVEVDDGNEDAARYYVPVAAPVDTGAGDVTDAGRRRVAASLRRLGHALRCGRRKQITLKDVRDVVFGRECPSLLTDRLADLIEPMKHDALKEE